jgi:cytochrome c5
MVLIGMNKYFSLLILLVVTTSCFDRPNPSKVTLVTPESTKAKKKLRAQQRAAELAKQEALRIAIEAEKVRLFEINKEKAWGKIVVDANSSFEPIKPILSRKCFDCHDSNRKLPLYGRILRRINPVYKHQRDGLKVLDFKDVFPLTVKGKARPSQISLLQAIKNSVIDRTMPIRSYTIVYRSRKVFASDEEKILNWVNPIITQIENYKEKFEPAIDDGSFKFKAQKVFENKCFRCHANGAHKGRFGDMEKMKELVLSKYVNLETPSKSLLHTIIASGDMPPSSRDALTDEELSFVLEWLKEEATNQIQ